MNLDRSHLAAAPVTFVGPRRVLIVDDHAPTRAAIKALLEEERPRIQVVATASDGATAIRLIGDAAPDVVLLDLDLGDEYGLDLMPSIGRHPGVAVIILTSSGDPLKRQRALPSRALIEATPTEHTESSPGTQRGLSVLSQSDSDKTLMRLPSPAA